MSPAARPRFVVIYGDRRVPLPDGDFVVGRGIGCDIRLNAETVSRQHVRLLVKNGRMVAENLSQTTGTLLNGARLNGSRSVTHGDELQMGPRKFRIEVEDADLSAATAPSSQTPDDYSDDELTSPGYEGPTGVVQPMLTQIDFHTCPQCRAKVAFGDSQCGKCGYAWSASDPSSVTGRVTVRNIAQLRDAAPTPAAVPVVYGSEELTLDAVVNDLRPDGAFIPSELLDPAGTSCELTLLPDGIFAMHVSAVVASVRRTADASGPAGMEVRFASVTPTVQIWIDRWLAAQRARP